MVSKRISVAARVKTQSPTSKPYLADIMNDDSGAKPPIVSHYNDWPNAIGFDTAYEENEPVELTVQGHIPAYAAGTLFRTGIGPRSVVDGNGKLVFKSNHWFDAFSQVHRFQLHRPSPASDSDTGIQKVTYNSRLTTDKLIERIQKTGKMDGYTFGARYEPCKSFFQKVQAVFEKQPDFKPAEVINAVTMSINYPGLSSTGTTQPSLHDNSKIATLCNKTDAARMQFLDPETLAPVGLARQSALHPSLKGPFSAAHPAVDPVTGDTYNYNLDFPSGGAIYRVFRTGASTGQTTVLASFKYPGAYLHSMFLTEHFLVLCIWNSHFTLKGASLLWERSVTEALSFNKESPATWFVVDRRCPQSENGKGVVAKFESDPFFAFHSVNSYETANPDGTVDIICDIPIFKDTSVLHHFYMDKVLSSSPVAHEIASKVASGRYDNVVPYLRRYRLSDVSLPTTTAKAASSSKTVSRATIDFTAPARSTVELPTINPAYATRPYRYTYGILNGDGTQSTFTDGLLKYDFKTREATKWSVQGHTPGEAIFIPRPRNAEKDQNQSKETKGAVDDEAEDDGVLLTVVLDGHTSKSYLLCLNAKDMTEMGRVDVDGAVGFGFHGVHTARL